LKQKVISYLKSEIFENEAKFEWLKNELKFQSLKNELKILLINQIHDIEMKSFDN
jgi:hypothetical protein